MVSREAVVRVDAQLRALFVTVGCPGLETSRGKGANGHDGADSSLPVAVAAAVKKLPGAHKQRVGDGKVAAKHLLSESEGFMRA